ncbi:hypothetical protein ScPMuIL_002731 [Solemya velum]
MPLDESNCAASFKVIVLGDASVGKTALVNQLMGRGFKERLRPTIVVDFVKKTFEVDGALVQLMVWDTAGEERFRSVTRWQYRNTQGMMVYDVTNRSSFSHLEYWLHNVNQEIAFSHNKYESVPIVLLGNKSDMVDQRQVKTEEGRKLADKELAFEFLETSAKTGTNVFTAFQKLAYHITEICHPKLMKSYHPHQIRPCKDEQTLTWRYDVSGSVETEAEPTSLCKKVGSNDCNVDNKPNTKTKKKQKVYSSWALRTKKSDTENTIAKSNYICKQMELNETKDVITLSTKKKKEKLCCTTN